MCRIGQFSFTEIEKVNWTVADKAEFTAFKDEYYRRRKEDLPRIDQIWAEMKERPINLKFQKWCSYCGAIRRHADDLRMLVGL